MNAEPRAGNPLKDTIPTNANDFGILWEKTIFVRQP